MAAQFESKNETTKKAREIARSLSYSDNQAQAAAKHLLLEMAGKIDAMEISVSVKKDGLFITDGLGRQRFGTIKERFLYRFFGVIPRAI
jgi:butyrate kinase